MKDFITFFSFSEPNALFVLIGVVLICSSSSIVGIFIFLQKKSLLGDAISHSLLPGVCFGFLFAGIKDPLALILGAAISGWLSIYAIEGIVKYSKLKEDTAVGLVLSVFFGLGILLLTYIQQSGNAEQSGLNHFIFGSAASIIGKDLYLLGGLSIVLYFVVYLFYKELKVYTFDREFAAISGLPIKTITFVINTLTVLAVVVGVQAMGVVMMASILITPAATARFWTHRLSKMIFIAGILSSVSGVIGSYISYASTAMPTGPWIVVSISIFAFLSFLFAPKKGLLAIIISKVQFQKKVTDENILKCLYQLGESSSNFYSYYNSEDMMRRRGFDLVSLSKGLKRLTNQGFLEINKENKKYKLTRDGFRIGGKVVKLHRLWELYLTEHLNIATDHVHEDADSIEHILTPELEKELIHKLGNPLKDPHDSPIPNTNLKP